MASFITILSSCLNKKKEIIINDTINKGSNIENINKSSYSVIKFKIDNQECFATINEYFKHYNYKSDFPFALWIKVETIEQNSNGHPTDNEALLFNEIEDSIISQLDKKTPYCFIGRTTRNGFREVMFYVSDKDKSFDLMNKFVNSNKFKRKIELTIDRDDKWKSVSGFIE